MTEMAYPVKVILRLKYAQDEYLVGESGDTGYSQVSVCGGPPGHADHEVMVHGPLTTGIVPS
jgi:hypothetical protein